MKNVIKFAANLNASYENIKKEPLLIPLARLHPLCLLSWGLAVANGNVIMLTSDNGSSRVHKI